MSKRASELLLLLLLLLLLIKMLILLLLLLVLLLVLVLLPIFDLLRTTISTSAANDRIRLSTGTCTSSKERTKKKNEKMYRKSDNGQRTSAEESGLHARRGCVSKQMGE